MIAVTQESSQQLQLPHISFGEHPPTVAPPWAQWAAEFGHRLHRERHSLQGGLVLLTTPCQSPLSAVLSLGYLIGQLEIQLPTPDLDAHFEFLYSLPAGTIVQFSNGKSTSLDFYELLPQRRRDQYIKMKYTRGRLRRRHAGTIIEMTREACARYQPESELERNSRAVGLDAISPYPATVLLENMSDRIPAHQNWQSNLDSLAVVGPTLGHASPRRQFDSTALVLNEEIEFSLSELLGVHEWKSSEHTPSLSRFVSSAGRNRDAIMSLQSADIVVFTSVEAWSRYSDALDQQLQVVVISRDIDESKLDSLDRFLRSYMELADEIASAVVSALPPQPEGIQLFTVGPKRKVETSWL